MKAIGLIAFILLLIGGLNRGLYGIWGFDLVAYLFGNMTTLSRIVYILVGVAALWKLIKMLFMKHNYKKE